LSNCANKPKAAPVAMAISEVVTFEKVVAEIEKPAISAAQQQKIAVCQTQIEKLRADSARVAQGNLWVAFDYQNVMKPEEDWNESPVLIWKDGHRDILGTDNNIYPARFLYKEIWQGKDFSVVMDYTRKVLLLKQLINGKVTSLRICEGCGKTTRGKSFQNSIFFNLYRLERSGAVTTFKPNDMTWPGLSYHMFYIQEPFKPGMDTVQINQIKKLAWDKTAKVLAFGFGTMIQAKKTELRNLTSTNTGA
ncbi:MAG: hypothetical protein PHT40_04740, partial [Patescibacteria group bacterium]|nr:hypothetical protein [Patescibacteria group bacterium]